MKKVIKGLTAAAAAFSAALFAAVGFYSAALPDSYCITKGTELKLSCFLDVEAARKTDGESAVMTAAGKSADNENIEYTLNLFGTVPLKSVTAKTVDAPALVPGGTPFGIKILTDGVIVAKLETVDERCPAEESGICAGDVIVSVGGEKISGNQELADRIMQSGGKSVVIILRRGEKEMQVLLTPEFSESDGTYKAGMWVRDSSAGIGTVTFYDPQTGIFGGLGHPVCDKDTGKEMPIGVGEVADVTITGYIKGSCGAPGELEGNFASSGQAGTIEINCETGVFGHLKRSPSLASAIPMAYKTEVQTGKATILTTIEGNEPKEYEVEIERVDIFNNAATKNLVIKVTDPELLSKTGGIVQGMSGSPIIQNGKLVGAVTHVFVNDPTRGYGIFAENMYKSAVSLNADAA